MGDQMEDVVFPAAQGHKGKNRKYEVVEFSVVRELTAADVQEIAAGLPDAAPKATITTIRESHHAAARALAEGMSLVEASAVTGYSPSYLSAIKADPTFAELVAFYREQGDQVRADLMERLRTLGLSATDELLKRLEENPDGWSRRELMELAELTLHKAGHTKGEGPKGPASGGPPSLVVQFIDAPPARDVKVIEADPLGSNPLQLERAE